MNYILKLFKNRKLIIGLSVLLITGFGAWFSWSEIKNGIYDKGYNDAVIEYQIKMAEQKAQYDEYVVYKLKQLRKDLEYQNTLEIEKVKKESSIDKEVETVTEYIKEKIYVKADCDTVPTELNGLFNDSIRTINGSKQD